MNYWWSPLLALPLLAASPPPRTLSLAVPQGGDMTPFGAPMAAGTVRQGGPVYAPAPLPNRDVTAPSGPRASNQPSVTPSLFTRRDQYRGEGFNPNSTAQIEQEKRVKPGAGFSLHMPLTSQ